MQMFSYTSSTPPRALNRPPRARLLERLWGDGGGCLRVQVLQEFFVIVTRKVVRPLSIDEVAERIREFARWCSLPRRILAAIAFQKQMRISFWDAMVVLAAAVRQWHRQRARD